VSPRRAARPRLLDQREVAERRRQHERSRDRSGGLGLDVHRGRVLLACDLVACFELALRQHLVLLEQLDGRVLDEPRQRLGRRAQVREPPPRRLGVPLLRVAVAGEHDAAVLRVGVLDDREDRALQRGAALQLRLQLAGQPVDRSATIVLSTVFGQAGDMLEPSARNSNLLPVNANGLVRLRSPECSGSCGSTGVPRPRNDPGFDGSSCPRRSRRRSARAPRRGRSR